MVVVASRQPSGLSDVLHWMMVKEREGGWVSVGGVVVADGEGLGDGVGEGEGVVELLGDGEGEELGDSVEDEEGITAEVVLLGKF